MAEELSKYRQSEAVRNVHRACQYVTFLRISSLVNQAALTA